MSKTLRKTMSRKLNRRVYNEFQFFLINIKNNVYIRFRLERDKILPEIYGVIDSKIDFHQPVSTPYDLTQLSEVDEIRSDMHYEKLAQWL